MAVHELTSDILARLQQTWNITVDRKALCHYNPRVNLTIDPTLKTPYEKTAAEFWDKKNFEPLNSLNYRQRLRLELYEQGGKNHKLKMEVTDEAAKNKSGLFANRRALTGAQGAPLAHLKVESVAHASAEDLARVLAEFPLEMISPDVAAYMAKKGWVLESRAIEAGLDLVTETWLPRARL